MKRRLVSLLLVIVLLLTCGSLALASHEVTLTVPLYGEEQEGWSGPACARMTFAAYPTPLYFTQTQLWNYMQAHKDDNPRIWYADPDGLTTCLNDMASGAYWIICNETDYSSQMYWIAYYMNKYLYPTPVVAWNVKRWVLITGLVTDVDPEASNTVIVERVRFNDPHPVNRGASHDVAAWVWQSDWYGGPVDYSSSKWFGQYVAVAEPPAAEGSALSVMRVMASGEYLCHQQATDKALSWVQQERLYDIPGFEVFRNALPTAGRLVRGPTRYYLVPFSSNPCCPTPDVAKTWDVCTDGTTFVFHLGREYTARDSSSLSEAFRQAFLELMRMGRLRDVASVKAVDDYTLSVQFDRSLRNPYARLAQAVVIVQDGGTQRPGRLLAAPGEASAGVLVDPVSGESLDAAAFEVPIQYVDIEEAVALFEEDMGRPPASEPYLFFTPCVEAESYFWPLWYFEKDGLYLDQWGSFHRKLETPPMVY
jgi:hypothetical protein